MIPSNHKNKLNAQRSSLGNSLVEHVFLHLVALEPKEQFRRRNNLRRKYATIAFVILHHTSNEHISVARAESHFQQRSPFWDKNLDIINIDIPARCACAIKLFEYRPKYNGKIYTPRWNFRNACSDLWHRKTIVKKWHGWNIPILRSEYCALSPFINSVTGNTLISKGFQCSRARVTLIHFDSAPSPWHKRDTINERALVYNVRSEAKYRAMAWNDFSRAVRRLRGGNFGRRVRNI